MLVPVISRIKAVKISVNVLTTNRMVTEVPPTSETSSMLNMPEAMEHVYHNSRVT